MDWQMGVFCVVVGLALALLFDWVIHPISVGELIFIGSVEAQDDVSDWSVEAFVYDGEHIATMELWEPESVFPFGVAVPDCEGLWVEIDYDKEPKTVTINCDRPEGE